jgi:hypothetical protein
MTLIPRLPGAPGRRAGRFVFSEPRRFYNPHQPRDRRGRWTRAGGPSLAEQRVNPAHRQQVEQRRLAAAAHWVDPNDPLVDTPEKVIAIWDRQVRDAVADSDVFIRVGDETLDDILRDGRVRNVHDTGTTGAASGPSASYLRNRRTAEERMFGIPQTAGPAERPIYGYFGPDPHGGGDPGQYGEVALRLDRARIQDRTTVTFADSLDYGGWETVFGAMMAPSPLAGPDSTSVHADTLRYHAAPYVRRDTEAAIDAFRGPSGYTEAQVHGGVSLADIDHVFFLGLPPEQETIELLEEAGIPWTVA